jgi:hypothetical protein
MNHPKSTEDTETLAFRKRFLGSKNTINGEINGKTMQNIGEKIRI